MTPDLYIYGPSSRMKILLHHPHRKLPLTAAVVIDSISLYRHIYKTSKGKTRKAARKRGRGGGGIKEKKTNKDISNRRTKERVYIGSIVRCPI